MFVSATCLPCHMDRELSLIPKTIWNEILPFHPAFAGMWDCHLNCELDLLYNLQSDADRREASCCTHAIAPGLTLRRVPGNPMIQTQI